MADLGNFNAEEEKIMEPMGDFELIEKGEYVAIITKSEWKKTKSGNGKYLELTLQIVEGEYKKRNLWVRLNLANPSEMAVKIAKSDLAKICKAVGTLVPKDSQNLHDKPMIISVGIKKDKGSDKEQNVINDYKPKNLKAAINNFVPDMVEDDEAPF